MEHWIQTALAIGFDVAVPCKVETLKPVTQVREMCAADRCHAYYKNWSCPPLCGTLEECEEKMQSYQRAILLQSIGHMTKKIDTRCYLETEQRHMEKFLSLVKVIRQRYPNALCLGAGTCRICKNCAYPEPCRFPDQVIFSMESYGLLVTKVCRDNGIPYYYGEKTIAYSACILF